MSETTVPTTAGDDRVTAGAEPAYLIGWQAPDWFTEVAAREALPFDTGLTAAVDGGVVSHSWDVGAVQAISDYVSATGEHETTEEGVAVSQVDRIETIPTGVRVFREDPQITVGLMQLTPVAALHLADLIREAVRTVGVAGLDRSDL